MTVDVRARARLAEQFGLPTLLDATEALRLTNLAGSVEPADVCAFRYVSREGAEAYRNANLEWYGHPSLAIVQDGDTWVGVLDLRPAIARARERSAS